MRSGASLHFPFFLFLLLPPLVEPHFSSFFFLAFLLFLHLLLPAFDDNSKGLRLQCFSLMSLLLMALCFSYLLWKLKFDEQGFYAIHLLLKCANHVTASSLDHVNAHFDHILLLASLNNDTMQYCSSHPLLMALYRAFASTSHVGPLPAIGAP